MIARTGFLRGLLALAAIFVMWPRSSAAIEIKRSTLSDGAILLVSEQHQLPMVTIAISFDAGARRDPQGKAGLAALTADSVEQGTKDLSAAEFDLQRETSMSGRAARAPAGRPDASELVARAGEIARLVRERAQQAEIEIGRAHV